MGSQASSNGCTIADGPHTTGSTSIFFGSKEVDYVLEKGKNPKKSSEIDQGCVKIEAVISVDIICCGFDLSILDPNVFGFAENT
jgi:hypothetical protein